MNLSESLLKAMDSLKPGHSVTAGSAIRTLLAPGGPVQCQPSLPNSAHKAHFSKGQFSVLGSGQGKCLWASCSLGLGS